MFGNIISAVSRVVTTPLAAVVDIAESVGIIEDSGVNHTAKQVQGLVTDIRNTVDAVEDARWKD